MTYTVTLPYQRPPLSLNQRTHWAIKARVVRELKDTTTLLTKAAKVPTCDRIAVTLHIRPRVTRRRDVDNLVATSKVCVDGIVAAGVVPDDTPAYVDHQMPQIHAVDKTLGPLLWLTIEAL